MQLLTHLRVHFSFDTAGEFSRTATTSPAQATGRRTNRTRSGLDRGR